MESFIELRKYLKKETNSLKEVKIAILSDNASEFISDSLKAYGIKESINLKIYRSDFNQIDINILVEESNLYKFCPDFVYLNFSTQKILSDFYKTSLEKRSNFHQTFILHIEYLLKFLLKIAQAKIILNNFNEINDQVFGNYSNKTSNSFLYQLRKINILLMEISQRKNDIYIVDFLSLQTKLGNENVVSNNLYLSTDMAYNVDFLPYLSKNIIDIILSNLGYSNKCIILDLDDTLWGGVIGDDGIDNIELGDSTLGRAYVEFQQWLLELKNRGIILCVCSKNEMKNAIEPFFKHPKMVLKKNDISIFFANWNKKVENIKKIKKLLNIDYNSILFFDDNPVERDLAKIEIPALKVPDLPESVANYLPYLKSLNLFETSTFDKNDEIRTKQYIDEIKRTELKPNFKTHSEYLDFLKMESSFSDINNSNIKRVHQLLLRTNQFNMTSKRYSLETLNSISKNNQFISLVFNLRDKYGDYGIVSSIFLNKTGKNYFIDNWVMSCRVFNRQFENFIMKQITLIILNINGNKLIGQYIKTKKNKIIMNLYKNMGFKFLDNQWELKIKNNINFPSQIKLI